MRVLITGGSGFIGTNLVTHLRDAGHDVLAIDVVEPRVAEHAAIFRHIDVRDQPALNETFSQFRPEAVVHLAARTDLHGEGLEDYSTNIQGVRNVIVALNSAAPTARTVFASSRMVCDIRDRPTRDDDYSPPNSYGESKAAGEMIVRQSTIPGSWTIVRPTSIWGPWFGVPYRDFFDAVLRGRYLHPRGHHVGKSFGYVGNTVWQLEQILKAPRDMVHGRTLYLGDYPPTDVKRMADLIRRRAERRPVHEVPLVFLRLAAVAGDLCYRLGWREPPLTSFRLSNLVTEMIYDLSLLEMIVGDLPFTLEQGVEVTVRWLADEQRKGRSSTVAQRGV